MLRTRAAASSFARSAFSRRRRARSTSACWASRWLNSARAARVSSSMVGGPDAEDGTFDGRLAERLRRRSAIDASWRLVAPGGGIDRRRTGRVLMELWELVARESIRDLVG